MAFPVHAIPENNERTLEQVGEKTIVSNCQLRNTKLKFSYISQKKFGYTALNNLLSLKSVI